MQARYWPWGAVVAATLAAAPANGVVSDEELRAAELSREEPLIANLRALAPRAADSYEQAIVHEQAGRWAEAETLLAEVHHEVPGFTAATRRLCGVEGMQGHRERALAHCREAAGDATSRSLAALSFALTGFGDVHHVSEPAASAEALRLAERAVAADPGDVLAQRALCFAARANGDGQKMRGCTTALERLDTRERAAAMWLERGRVLVASATRTAEPDAVALDEGAYSAKHAAKIRGGWAEPTFLLAEIAIQRRDAKGLHAAVESLRESAPEDVRTAKLEVVAAVAAGDGPRARAALARAEALGLDAASLAPLEQQVQDLDPLHRGWLPALGGVLVLTVGALGIYVWRRKARSGGAS